jgi:SOS-response transcriptional repressor LexA
MIPSMARTRAGIAIQQRMSDVGLTQASLGRRLGRSQTWVSQSLLDDTERTLRRMWVEEPERFQRLLELLEWESDEFARRTGMRLPATTLGDADAGNAHLETPDLRGATRTIPVYDLLSAGAGVDGGTVIDVVDIPVAWEGHYAAYEVVGDSMAPHIPEGARVVIRVQDYANPGDEIVAWVPDIGMVVKVFDRVTPEGEVVLASYNPEYRPIWASEARIYGVVVEVRLRRKRYRNGKHGPN